MTAPPDLCWHTQNVSTAYWTHQSYTRCRYIGEDDVRTAKRSPSSAGLNRQLRKKNQGITSETLSQSALAAITKISYTDRLTWQKFFVTITRGWESKINSWLDDGSLLTATSHGGRQRKEANSLQKEANSLLTLLIRAITRHDPIFRGVWVSPWFTQTLWNDLSTTPFVFPFKHAFCLSVSPSFPNPLCSTIPRSIHFFLLEFSTRSVQNTSCSFNTVLRNLLG